MPSFFVRLPSQLIPIEGTEDFLGEIQIFSRFSFVFSPISPIFAGSLYRNL